MPAFDVDDTIAAIASPPGPGLRGIVRLSGPQAVAGCLRIFRSDDDTATKHIRDALSKPDENTYANPKTNPGTASQPLVVHGAIRLSTGELVPGQLLLWPGQRSYTRQPTAEFHTISAKPILQLILLELCRSGVRLANPGEFTLRAFLSGRIDLTQAEAVLAVIDAEGQTQLETATEQLAGGLAGPLQLARTQLLSVLAELEAGLDFVEEDIEFISANELAAELTVIQSTLSELVAQVETRDSATERCRVVLSGMANAGKSSLFNLLTNSDTAIVTELAGTTTDFLMAQLKIGEQEIELVDTAGFENSIDDNEQPLPELADSIPQQAQQQRESQQQLAPIELLCIDASEPLAGWARLRLAGESSARIDRSKIVVLTKTDLVPLITTETIREAGFSGPVVALSTVDGTGKKQLLEELALTAMEIQPGDTTIVGTTVLRAGQSLRQAQKAVEYALEAANNQLGEELIAAEIRQSLESLGQVAGAVYTDDILDLVFGRFCIGK